MKSQKKKCKIETYLILHLRALFYRNKFQASKE